MTEEEWIREQLEAANGGKAGRTKRKKRNLLQNLGHAAKSPIRAGGRAITSKPVAKTLDVLDRPVQGVKGAVIGMGGEVATGVLRNAGLPLDPKAAKALGLDKGGPAQAARLAARGLSGKEKFSSQQAVRSVTGVQLPTQGVPGAVVGLAGDVALDPLTYVSFGTGTAAKAGLRKVGQELGPDAADAIARHGLDKAARKGLVSLDEVKAGLTRATGSQEGVALAKGGAEGVAARELKALSRRGAGGMAIAGRTVVPGQSLLGRAVAAPGRAVVASPAGEAVRTALVPRARLATVAGKDAADRVGEAFSKSRAFEDNSAAAVVDELRQAVKQTKATEAELTGVVRRALDVEGGDEAVPARLVPLVDKLKEVRAATTEAQLGAEVFRSAHLHDEDTYLLRAFTDAGRKALDRPTATRPGTRLTDAQRKLRQGGSTSARELAPNADLGTAERMLTAMNGPLRSKVLRRPQKYYEHNAAKLVGGRAIRSAKAVAQSRLVDDLAKITDDAGEALVHHEAGAGLTPVKIGEREVFAHPEVARELERSNAILSDDAAIRGVLKSYDKVLNAWKGLATVPLVGTGFHARNAQGNFWNNFLAGVKDPRDYAEAARLQRAMGAGKKLEGPDAEVLRLAEDHGIFNRGAQEADLAKRDALAPLRGKGAGGTLRRRLSPLSDDNVAVASGRAVGSAIENNARLAHFLHVLRQTGDAERAAMSVKRHLFDYADLTPLERKGIKRVVPFYTFMRKNTPLQLAELARQPGKFTGLAHGARELNEEFELDLPPNAAVKALTAPLQPGGLANLPGGGLLGAAKTQAFGKTIPIRGTEEFRTIPAGSGSESRAEALLADLVPLYGRFGKVSAAGRSLREGQYLKLLGGLRRRETEAEAEAGVDAEEEWIKQQLEAAKRPSRVKR